MDRVQLVAILLAVGILVYWFTTVPRRPAPQPARQAPGVTQQSESVPPPPASGTPAIAPVPEQETPPTPEARYDLTQGGTTTLENDVPRLRDHIKAAWDNRTTVKSYMDILTGKAT